MLLDQHDDLLIEISVAADAPAPCSDRLDELNKRLIQVENELAKSWSK